VTQGLVDRIASFWLAIPIQRQRQCLLWRGLTRNGQYRAGIRRAHRGHRPRWANPHAPRFDDPDLPAKAPGGKLHPRSRPQRVLALRPVATIQLAGTFPAKQENGVPWCRSGNNWIGHRLFFPKAFRVSPRAAGIGRHRRHEALAGHQRRDGALSGRRLLRDHSLIFSRRALSLRDHRHPMENGFQRSSSEPRRHHGEGEG